MNYYKKNYKSKNKKKLIRKFNTWVPTPIKGKRLKEIPGLCKYPFCLRFIRGLNHQPLLQKFRAVNK